MAKEVDYELNVRGIPLEDELSVRRMKLRQAQVEEIRKPKRIKGVTSMVREYETVKTRVQEIRNILETKYDQKQMSRLRHYRIRVNRTNTITRGQLRQKKELLGEIESLLDEYIIQ